MNNYRRVEQTLNILKRPLDFGTEEKACLSCAKIPGYPKR